MTETPLLAMVALALAVVEQNRTGRDDHQIQPLGPLPAAGDTRTDDLEICWSDHISRTILEGSGRTMVVPMNIDLVLGTLAGTWLKIVVDETVTEGGEGLVEVWVRKEALLRFIPTGVWTFVSGQPIRLQTAILRSGRRIFGVLGHAKELSSEKEP